VKGGEPGSSNLRTGGAANEQEHARTVIRMTVCGFNMKHPLGFFQLASALHGARLSRGAILLSRFCVDLQVLRSKEKQDQWQIAKFTARAIIGLPRACHRPGWQ
jgi:hypothetical protein